MSREVNTEDKCLERAKIIARICYEKRLEDIRLIDLRNMCPYADYFVIGTGKSAPQIRGVLKDIQAEMSKLKYRLINEAGRGGDEWALIDYGDIVAHIFSSEAREYYQLEELWADAPEIDFLAGYKAGKINHHCDFSGAEDLLSSAPKYL